MLKSLSFELRELGEDSRLFTENILPSTPQTSEVRTMVIRELAKGQAFHPLPSDLTQENT